MRLYRTFMLLVLAFLCGTLVAIRAQEEGERFEFQAEVSRLMDIIINSLYAKRDVFLRELLSNASDALDRIRFLALKDSSKLGQGEDRELEIRLSFDKEARTLTIRDRGSGMTRAELIKNLGTVAKSGTTEFVEKLVGAQGDLSMIGQFGVGFYSAYLAADRVVVTSKSNDDPDQWIWASSANATFTITKDPEGNTLGRGTSIVLHLKEDADEYLDAPKLEEIVRRYSEFISYPIYLRKPVREEVPDEEASAEEGEGDGEKEEETKKPKTKTITTLQWVRVNDQPAIWTRPKEEIKEEEYNAFYKAISKDWSDPLAHAHFSAEGEIEFKALLYVPKVAPPGLYENYYTKSAALKLYVRRVLIADEFDDLLPRYLNFIRGVVDSDDMPLNVSREQLQQSRILKVIGKKLVRKVLEMLKQMSDEDVNARKAEGKTEGEAATAASEEETKFATMWKQFSKSFKLGVIEDAPNRVRLAKMLRFTTTTTSKQQTTTLEEYLARAPEWQAGIFYVTGDNLAELRRSPFIERAKAKGVEVLLLHEPIDEYLMQTLSEFEGKRMVNLAKENVKFGDESANDARLEAHYKDTFTPFTTWLKSVLGEAVERVVVSTRVTGSPAIVVTSQFGHTATMERIMRSQTMNDPERAKMMQAKKILEINPRHPLVAELAKRSAEGENEETKDLAWALYDSALLTSGFDIASPNLFSQRMLRIVKKGLGVVSDELLPEPELPPVAASEGAGSGAGETGGVDLDEL